MKKDKIPKSRIIVPHIENCFMKNSETPFSGIPVGKFYGNRAANQYATIGVYHLWIKVSCNDPKCPAIKAVHSQVLAKAE